MKHVLHIFIILMILLSSTTCSSLFNSDSSGPVDAALVRGDLQIANRSEVPAYYFAHAEGALITWSPVSSEKNKIAPGQSVSIPLSEVSAYMEGNNIVVNYWTGSDPSINSVRQILVEID